MNIETKPMAVPVKLCADNWLDAGFGGGLREFDFAMKIVFVGKRDGRKLVLDGDLNDGVDRQGGIEKRIVTVEIERDEGRSNRLFSWI